MRVVSLDSPRDTEQLSADWWALWDRTFEREPTQTPAWMLAWWKTFAGADRTPFVLAAYDGAVLVGLAPLLVRTEKYRGVVPTRVLELVATGEDDAHEINSDFVGVLAARDAEDDVARRFVRALIARAADWDELRLAHADRAGKSTLAIEHALAENAIRVAEQPRGICPRVVLPSTWSAFESGLGEGGKAVVASAPAAKLEYARTPGEIAKARPLLARIDDVRFRGATPFTAFHERVMPELAARGAVELAWLTSDRGEPLALAYHLLRNRSVYRYASGVIEPGFERALAVACVRDAIARGLEDYVFVDGADDDKRVLAGEVARRVVTVSAISPSPRGRALVAARKAIDAAAAIRKHR